MSKSSETPNIRGANEPIINASSIPGRYTNTQKKMIDEIMLDETKIRMLIMELQRQKDAEHNHLLNTVDLGMNDESSYARFPKKKLSLPK